jgi:hypothetical protein
MVVVGPVAATVIAGGVIRMVPAVVVAGRIIRPLAAVVIAGGVVGPVAAVVVASPVVAAAALRLDLAGDHASARLTLGVDLDRVCAHRISFGWDCASRPPAGRSPADGSRARCQRPGPDFNWT